MTLNKDGFNVLASLKAPIDTVVRVSEFEKLDFPGVPFIETKLTEKYGYQVVLGAYGSEGKWPIRVVTEYRIDRPRIEIAVPAADSLKFLKELRKNLAVAIKEVEHWERMRGL
jgi:hypothetical protein